MDLPDLSGSAGDEDHVLGIQWVVKLKRQLPRLSIPFLRNPLFLNLPPGESRIFEIGGMDVVSYGDLIREYARQKGLRRWLISVPVLTPYLTATSLA